MFKMEPVVHHQPVYTTENPDLYKGLTGRMGTATVRMQVCALHALGALIVALLGFGSGVTQTACVLAFASTLCAIWFALMHNKYDTLLHVLNMRESLQPSRSGEDWLAYHLAERIRQEQLDQAAQDAADAADAAVAAIDAWIAAGEPEARPEDHQVH